MTKIHIAARVALALAAWAVAALPAVGQLPTTQLTSIFPSGGRQATAVEVEIAGSDLEGVDRLDFSHPGIRAEAKQTAAAISALPAEQVPNRFVVSVAADVPPGLYDVRAVGRFGISNPRTFVVGPLPELSEESTNASSDKAMHIPLDTVVNGRSAAGVIDYFRFTARQGQRVLIELWAERIDSRMDGTLSLLAATGRELGHSRDAIGRDPLLDVEIPADGEYTLAAYDMLYQGGNDYFYRLTVRTGPHVDFVFPPCGLPGGKEQATILGRNLPGSAAVAAIRFDDRPLRQTSCTIDYPSGAQATQLNFAGHLPSRSAFVDGFAYRWPTPQGPANSHLLTYASAPVMAEQEPNDAAARAQKLKPPCELAGWFAGTDDADWLQFDARAGQVYWIEVVSQRRGESSDPCLLVQRVTRDAQGKEQASDVGEADDEPGKKQFPGFPIASADPIYRFAAPAAGTYRVLVRDLAPSVAPRPYTLAIRERRPDFRLVAVPIYPSSIKNDFRPWSLLVRRGGTAMLDVMASRRDNFDGEIEISAAGLPPGIKARPVVLGAGQSTAHLVFECLAEQPSWAGTIEVLGTAHVDGHPITRQARSGTVLWPPMNPKKASPLVPGRMAHGIALSATADESLPVRIELGEQKFDMSRAGKLQLPVKVIRSGFKDALTLVPVDLPPAIKAAPLTIAAGKSEGQLVLDIAAGAVPGEYSLVLRSEVKINYRRDEGAPRVANEQKAALQKIAAQFAAAAAKASPAEKKKNDAALQAIAAAKAAADKRAAAAVPKTKPLAVVLYSTPARLKITAGPVELSVKDPPPVARPGEIKVPVAVVRRYNYAEQIVLEPVVSPPLPDLKISASPIAAGKTAGHLSVTIGPKTPPGTHRITVRSRPKFNNQVLEVETSFTLTVQ